MEPPDGPGRAADRARLGDRAGKRNSAAHRVHAARWIKRNPEKRRAHHDVRNALRRGTLEREPCPCGRPGQAHHDDYSRPLNVRWLCPAHHKAAHADARR